MIASATLPLPRPRFRAERAVSHNRMRTDLGKVTLKQAEINREINDKISNQIGLFTFHVG